MNINKKLTSINHTALKRTAANIEYIVIHYVGALGDAKANATYYASQKVGASADFFVGFAGDIWQGNDYYNYYSWHCGGGYQSSLPDGGKFYGKCTNRNSIGIEMCVKKKSTKTMNATDKDWYFEAATVNATAQLVAQLMRELNVDINHVIRHFDVNKKICPNPFVFNTGAYTWASFKSMVNHYANGGQPTTETKWYRVRRTWADTKSQLGAYEVLENAKKNCPVGYTVFDWNGKAVYTPVDAVSSAQPNKYPSGVPASKSAYIEAVGAICRDLMAETGILASVVAAQCCLETGYGLDPSCKVLMDVNNLLGMKTDLINNTWSQWSVWSGKSITKQTPEYYNGKLVYVNDSFRAYSDYEQCIRDYEMFLLHVRNNKGYKYASIQGMTDPAAVIRRIRIGTGTTSKPEGYCTDPAYETKILQIIKENNLTRFDVNVQKTEQNSTKPQETAKNTSAISDKYVVRKSFEDAKSQTNSFNNLDYAKRDADKHGYTVYEASTGNVVYSPVKDKYAVRHSLEDTKYQTGLYHDLKNAKADADANWGYKVYDISANKLVYEPKLTTAQKFAAAMVYFDLIVRDDIAAKKFWDYRNKNTSSFSKTFWKAREDNNRHTNCVSALQWALLEAGVPREAIQWYGNKGIVWVGSDAEKNARKYFNIVNVGDKTVKQCLADGTIQPMDIVTYVKLSHTNAYITAGMWFDSGHANCSGSGEGAMFNQWTCVTPYAGYKVAKILRLK